MSRDFSIYFFILTTLIIDSTFAQIPLELENEVGYRLGKVDSYTKLRRSQKSTLYRIQASELDDGRPMKLLDLHGTHYEVGFDYGYLMGDEIEFTYNSLFNSELNNSTVETKAVEQFLDWQYSSYVGKHTPFEFLQEIKGVKNGALKSKKITKIDKKIQRILVLSNFPGAPSQDVIAVLLDQFLKKALHIKSDKVQNYIQSNLLYAINYIAKFIKKKQILCSFFGVWGSRTKNGELYSMRNLDWAADTGINLNKMVIIFHIVGTYSHAVLGFPGLIGALTGISEKGITVHQAGQSSHLQSMEGFQWTLRMRYVMMNAKNLKEAMKIWNSTKNTLGMNFMIGSAEDKKAVALETMRGHTAVFQDNDPRENRTIFTDEQGNKYVGGYSMPQVVFRTNHAYDPIIRKHSMAQEISQKSSTMTRYRIMRDQFNFYQSNETKIGIEEAVRITAILGDKGSDSEFYSCLKNSNGLNVISATFLPSELKMWAAFEYGSQKSFRSASCGVYVEIDLNQWFNPQDQTQNVRMQ